MITIKHNIKPILPSCEMLCDKKLHKKLENTVYKHYRFFTGLSHFEKSEDEIYEQADITIGRIAPIISPLNGALLSGCQSHELSADAYINNRYNGAFTHYLIKNLHKYSDTKNMKDVIALVNKDLAKNGYDQSPQSEGLLENNFFFL